jgi:hypothetical protein
MMSTRRTKMLGLGMAAIAFLLATIPVFHSGVLYADEGDHGDHDNGDHDNDGDHHNNCDSGDHDHGDCNHGDHDNEDHDGNND